MTAHYPAITAATYARNRFVWDLVHDPALKSGYLHDHAAGLADTDVDDATRAALLVVDLDALLALGVHPMLCASLRGMTHSFENPDDYTYY
jgi:hypothetical protein